ncbi:MAG: DUF6445 family protein [Luteimonas sp.]
MFNPHPRIEVLPVADGRSCYVIDDALHDPEQLVAYAVAQRAGFVAAPYNAYPGLELRLLDDVTARLVDFFRVHLRQAFGARRVQRARSRLSMVTLPPDALRPSQWICHRDRIAFAANQCIVASVLYLFRDCALGGTSFYTSKLSARDTAQLMRDSVTQDADTFAATHGVARGYMTGSNAYFDHALTVEARWNRLILYDGDLFHTGDIRAPQRMCADPVAGRLSFNGFLTCSRSAI